MINEPIAATDLPIYHLTPAYYYQAQPADQPYQSASFNAEGFIHCTSGAMVLVQVANRYFANLLETLLVLEIDRTRLTVPLKFEAPGPPPQTDLAQQTTPYSPELLFPHIYGPIDRAAIIACFALERDETGRWTFPTS